MDSFYLGYYGPEWDRKIQDRNHPNFWKYGVASLVFLDLVKDRKRVLDVGCGTGGLALFLAEQMRFECIIGIDVVKSMIEVAKQQALQKGLSDKIHFVVCDGRHLPFRRSFFDALVCRGDVFSFLVPQREALAEFRIILKKAAILAIEQDNVQWKPGRIISYGFERTADGRIAYSIERFDRNRDRMKVFYVLDPDGAIAKKMCRNGKFVRTRKLSKRFSLREIGKETIETRRSAVTHWADVDEIRTLFVEGGFKDIEVFGDGLLMGLLLGGHQKVVEAMKRQPELFFEIERRLIRFIDLKKALTIILKAVTS